MLVKIENILFPTAKTESPNGYTILSARCLDTTSLDSNGKPLGGNKFTMAGTAIPTSTVLKYDVDGTWDRNKYGPYFKVIRMDPIVENNKESIINYLSSKLIKGIGPATAAKIYMKFGDNTLSILDENPYRLTEVEGISTKKLETIVTSYQQFRGARSVVEELTKFNFNPNKAVKVYQKYRGDALDIIKNHPYKLCEFNGFSFASVDYMALAKHGDPLSTERFFYGILDVLFNNELNGNLFMYVDSLYIGVAKKLNISLTESNKAIIKTAIKDLCIAKKITIGKHPIDSKYITYRYAAHEAETKIAKKLLELIKKPAYNLDYQQEIENHELDTGWPLAKEQKQAVITALNNRFSIITGGPGTGKTTIIDYITNIKSILKPNASIILCAPTGKAARRMTESTGMGAFTVHKILNLVVNEEGSYNNDTTTIIDCDLLIIDETSMLDIYLTSVLLSNISTKTQVVFIGDVDQLPSVGPGAVLYELINSNKLPVVRLTQVYRQSHGSKIPINAANINQGNWSLDYDNTFQFIPVKDFEDAADKMKAVYMRAVDEVGIDNVIMLSPMRKKTETCVNALNEAIHDVINPDAPEKHEIQCNGIKYRVGDKVMQMRNSETVSNGETGEITKISINKDEAIISIDFGDNRVVEYYRQDMANVSLAYATTIHKSQGSEYDTVIINLMMAHKTMLKRNLLYTAVTRAKRRVIIIGDQQAIITSVQNGLTDKDKRLTLLAERLKLM